MNNTTSFPRMHVSFYVSNLEKTIAFYNTFFDQQPEKVEDGYTKYILEKPSLIISFIENPERVQAHFGHLGFQVESVDAVISRLAEVKSKSLLTKEEVGVNCCYALQDKFWVNDPDGYQWEVYYFHQDAKFNDPRYENAEDGEALCCTSSETEEAPCAATACKSV